MAETLLYQGVAVNPANGLRLAVGHRIAALSTDDVLLPQSAQFQALDPDGSNRDVTLPAEEASQGLFFIIKNTANAGGEDLVVKDDAASTVVTLAQNQCSIVACDGSSWTSLGVITFA